MIILTYACARARRIYVSTYQNKVSLSQQIHPPKAIRPTGTDSVTCTQLSPVLIGRMPFDRLQDQLRKRTDCLERLLAEERDKRAAAETSLKTKGEPKAAATAAKKQEAALQEREREIRAQEVREDV